jgi:hypothetical protein
MPGGPGQGGVPPIPPGGGPTGLGWLWDQTTQQWIPAVGTLGFIGTSGGTPSGPPTVGGLPITVPINPAPPPKRSGSALGSVGHNARTQSGKHFGHHKGASGVGNNQVVYYTNTPTYSIGGQLQGPANSADGNPICGAMSYGGVTYFVTKTTGTQSTNSMLRYLNYNKVQLPPVIIKAFYLPPGAVGFQQLGQPPSAPRIVIIPITPAATPGLITPPTPAPPPASPPKTPRLPNTGCKIRGGFWPKASKRKDFVVQHPVTHCGGLPGMHEAFVKSALALNLPTTKSLQANIYAPNPLTLYPLTADLWNGTLSPTTPGPNGLILANLPLQLTGDFMNGTRQKAAATLSWPGESSGPVTYQETDTASVDTCSNIDNALSIHQGAVEASFQAKIGGTAGTTSHTLTVLGTNNGGLSNQGCLMFESPAGDPNLATWPAGNLTAGLDVTGTPVGTLNAIWLARVTSGGTASLVASNTSLGITLTAGVITISLNYPQSNGNASDKWAIILGFSPRPNNYSVSFKSDSTITFSSLGPPGSPPGTLSVSVGHTHVALIDPTIVVPDGYSGAIYQESGQFSGQVAGLNAPYFMAIPAGQTSNFWQVISQGVVWMPQRGKQKYLTLDRFGTPGNWQILV